MTIRGILLIIVTVFSGFAFAKGGAGSFGGGAILNPDVGPSYEQFLQRTQHILKMLPFVLHQTELTADEKSLFAKFPAVHEKFFTSKGNRIVYQILPQIKYEYLRDAPCLDPKGEEKDASARTDENGLHICLSYLRLTLPDRQLTNRNSWQKVSAVIVHELTHLLVGDNEDLAKAVEEIIRNQVTDVTFETFGLELGRMRDNLGAVLSGVTLAIESLRRRSDPAAMYASYISLNWLDDVLPNPDIFGISAFDKKHLLRYVALTEQIEALGYFWEKDQNERAELNKIFSNRRRITAREFIAGKNDLVVCHPFCDEMNAGDFIYRINSNDRKHALLQMQEIEKILKVIVRYLSNLK